jgi:hypothetical protein
MPALELSIIFHPSFRAFSFVSDGYTHCFSRGYVLCCLWDPGFCSCFNQPSLCLRGGWDVVLFLGVGGQWVEGKD